MMEIKKRKEKIKLNRLIGFQRKWKKRLGSSKNSKEELEWEQKKLKNRQRKSKIKNVIGEYQKI